MSIRHLRRPAGQFNGSLPAAKAAPTSTLPTTPKLGPMLSSDQETALTMAWNRKRSEVARLQDQADSIEIRLVASALMKAHPRATHLRVDTNGYEDVSVEVIRKDHPATHLGSGDWGPRSPSPDDTLAQRVADLASGGGRKFWSMLAAAANSGEPGILISDMAALPIDIN